MKYELLDIDFTTTTPTCEIQCPCGYVEHVAFDGWVALVCRGCREEVERFSTVNKPLEIDNED